MKIILDTNFLLIPSQFNVDIFSEIDRIVMGKYQLFILDKTLDELNKIINTPKQKLRNKRAAKLALQLIKAKNLKLIKTVGDKSVDDFLVEIKGYTIATQDFVLKKRLKEKNTPLIILRAKNYLVFD